MVKDAAYNDELRYSLRSLSNIPHGRVFFFGGVPHSLTPDVRRTIHQTQTTKYDRVHAMLRQVANDPELSEEFLLFNDDFFIIRPITHPSSPSPSPSPSPSFPQYYDGHLDDLIKRVESSFGHPTSYTMRLRKTSSALHNPKNFEVHVPLLMTKTNLRTVLSTYPDLNGVRTIYGTMFPSADQQQIIDPKVWSGTDNHRTPSLLSTPFISTDDESFSRGRVGSFIRSILNEKSKYER